MKNKEQIKYTYLHRRAFMDVVETLILSSEEKTALLQKAAIHDLDKMAMYLFYSVKDTHTFHRANVSHHTGGFKKKYAGETTVTPEMRLGPVRNGGRLGMCQIYKTRQTVKCI